jgi:hypothetical protein
MCIETLDVESEGKREVRNARIMLNWVEEMGYGGVD